jgi:hypothetical protein
MSLSAEAEKRKERLLALKKRKRGQTDDVEEQSQESLPADNDDSEPQSKVTKPYAPNLLFLTR